MIKFRTRSMKQCIRLRSMDTADMNLINETRWLGSR